MVGMSLALYWFLTIEANHVIYSVAKLACFDETYYLIIIDEYYMQAAPLFLLLYRHTVDEAYADFSARHQYYRYHQFVSPHSRLTI